MVRWIQLSKAQSGSANSTHRVKQAQQGQTAAGLVSSKVVLPLGAGGRAAAFSLSITASAA